MKTSGLFTIHSVRIPKVDAGEVLWLFPFGDVHYDSPSFNRRVWDNSVACWKEKLKTCRCYFLGVGDYLDGFSTSERVIMGDRKIHDSTRSNIQDGRALMVKKFSEEISFMRGNLIGLMNGNHYAEFQDGTNSDQRLCSEMGCKYLGVQTFVRLAFQRNKSTGNFSLDIFAHHGKGCARLTGSSFNTVEQMAEYASADIYIMGDSHNRGILPGKPLLELSGCASLVMNIRPRWLVRSGGYLGTHEPGTVSYIHDTCGAPRSMGHVELELKLTRDCSGGDDRTYVAVRGIA
jgi:hypothetical protein